MPREFRSFRVEAVVLRHSDWGEADRILILYTRQRGKLRTVARGVRKIRSRKAGHLEPFTHVSLQLAKARDLPIITQAETIDPHPFLRENLVMIGYASYVVELLDKFTYEEGENLSLFNLLNNTLTRLENPGSDLLLVLRYYEMRLLDFVGFRPELFHCVSCGDEIKPEDQYFSAEQGGVLCPKCGKGAFGAHPISKNALRYLRHFQRSSYAQATRAQPPPEIHREMETLMEHFLTYVLERKLNTPSFLRRVRKSSKSAEYARPTTT